MRELDAVLTAVNFTYFYLSKRFKICRFFQVLISMLLPFMFQWSLGGFVPSGAVMLWSLISLAGSLTFQDVRLGLRWLAAFLVLTAVSGLIDQRLQSVQIEVAPEITTLFFVLNISIIATIVFVLNVYLLAKRDEARRKLAELSDILKRMFGRYLSTTVMNTLIEDPTKLELGGVRRRVTIMMSDLRGFTALSERLEPEQVVQLLNTYFEIMVDLVLKYNGTINEFIGDSLLVVFGAPSELDDRAHRAVACAIEMQNAMDEVNAQNRANGLPELEMGIGLHEADVVVGNVGSTKRSKYAVVGGGVNVASRIESSTVGGQILVSSSVVDEVGEVLRIDSQRDINPKGVESGLRIFEIGGIAGNYNQALKHRTQKMTGLQREVPVVCTPIEDKSMVGEWLEGALVELSREAAKIRVDTPLPSLTNIALRLRGVDERLGVTNFYAKVTEEAKDGSGTCTVSFTSVPLEISAYLQACRQYATVE
jgi:adenylate cyclase